MMTTEGSTKIVNFMNSGAGFLVLGHDHTSHTCEDGTCLRGTLCEDGTYLRGTLCEAGTCIRGSLCEDGSRLHGTLCEDDTYL